MSEQANMRGFTFFFNYYTAISQSGISLEEQAKAYNAICAYVFFGEEPKCDGAGSLVVNLLKPSLDRAIRNVKNRKKQNGNAMETEWKQNGNAMEIEWKQNGNAMEIEKNGMEIEKNGMEIEKNGVSNAFPTRFQHDSTILEEIRSNINDRDITKWGVSDREEIINEQVNINDKARNRASINREASINDNSDSLFENNSACAPAREDDEEEVFDTAFSRFVDKWGINTRSMSNYSAGKVGGIDWDAISEWVGKSSYLQQQKALSFYIDHADDILDGKYFDFKRRGGGKAGTDTNRDVYEQVLENIRKRGGESAG